MVLHSCVRASSGSSSSLSLVAVEFPWLKRRVLLVAAFRLVPTPFVPTRVLARIAHFCDCTISASTFIVLLVYQ